MVRALDYEWDAQTHGVEVQASAVHFSFLEFFSKRLMSFIISRIIAILLQISFIIFDYRIRPFIHIYLYVYIDWNFSFEQCCAHIHKLHSFLMLSYCGTRPRWSILQVWRQIIGPLISPTSLIRKNLRIIGQHCTYFLNCYSDDKFLRTTCSDLEKNIFY